MLPTISTEFPFILHRKIFFQKYSISELYSSKFIKNGWWCYFLSNFKVCNFDFTNIRVHEKIYEVPI
ncbi:MAG: hypothetical protein ABS44_05350 [Chryseobacterium sp. SCN 40-13]|nr:MAG: hypothetical protein ABS44_05350 [Chryseobacterium sp. SCN 40-13]